MKDHKAFQSGRVVMIEAKGVGKLMKSARPTKLQRPRLALAKRRLAKLRLARLGR